MQDGHLVLVRQTRNDHFAFTGSYAKYLQTKNKIDKKTHFDSISFCKLTVCALVTLKNCLTLGVSEFTPPPLIFSPKKFTLLKCSYNGQIHLKNDKMA